MGVRSLSDLYSRILLWHKLVAMQTGGLALCSAKRKLNVTEATGWVEGLRKVADDIEAFLRDGTFVLDDRGQRVVALTGERTSLEPAEQGGRHVGSRNEEKGTQTPATSPKAGGRRVATRKT